MPDTADAFVYTHVLEMGIDAWKDPDLRAAILHQQTEAILADVARRDYQVVGRPRTVDTYFYYWEGINDDEAIQIWCDETDPQVQYAKNMMEVHCRATYADHTRPATD